jgi:hypothetical protein
VTSRHSASGQAPADAARNEPTTRRYEIRIKGRVSEETAFAFDGLALDVRPVETVLHGEITDQAALHGLLDRVADLGLELIEVRRLPEAPEAPVASPAPPHPQAPAVRRRND